MAVKKGKLRADLRRPVRVRPRKPAYVPASQYREPRRQLRRAHWCTDLPSLVRMTRAQLLKHLRGIGFIPDLSGAKCPVCNKGTLSGLRTEGTRCSYRCSSRKCNRRIPLLHGHPLFCKDDQLDAQVQALFALMAGVKQNQLGLLTHFPEARAGLLASRVRALQKYHVIQQQRQVLFGNGGRTWVQVETDEVSLRARKKGGVKFWQRYLAILERGDPKKVVVERLPGGKSAGAGHFA